MGWALFDAADLATDCFGGSLETEKCV